MRLLHSAAKIFMSRRFGHKSIEHPMGEHVPFIVLSNHVTDFDAGYMMADIPEAFRPVASEHVLNMPVKGFLVKNLLHPITVVKGSIKVRAVMDILKALKSGENIMMHPEGTRSFDGRSLGFGIETGKLVKSSKATLVTYRIEGGYFNMPRWALYGRKGKARGQVVGVYTPEELKSMSAEEVTQLIHRDIYVDDYALQRERMLPYKGKNLAEGIENLIFLCPSCQGVGTLKGRGNRASCSCGFSAEFDIYGFFNKTESVSDWNDRQHAQLDAMYSKEISFSDEAVTLSQVEDGGVRNPICEGTLTGFWDRLEVGEQSFSFGDFQDKIELTDKGNEALFTVGKIHYHLSGSGVNMYKYTALYEKFTEIT